jgi:hypothetical protein
MATFLDETSNDANPWKISRGSGPPADVQNKYYILSQGQGTYRQGLQHPFYFTVSYLVAQKVGGTVSLSEGLESTLVSPMQLFVVKKNTAGNGTMTIPASLRRHGNINYFRSAHQTEQYNQFLIQTMADEDGGYDRICVVFDQYGELASSDPYDAVKIFNGSEGVNQIYTLSTDGKQMTTSVIPYTVKTLPLYLQPAALEQHITLSTHRLNTLSNIGLLQLEDRFTGATTNLLETPQYRFVTQPGDSPDRFLLHFKLFEEINQTLASTLTENVSVYYSGSSLFVKGLSESRTGSQLVVCDMNGRTVVAKRIDTAPDFECPLSLHPGAYIVKLSGKTDCIIKKIVINH